MKAIKITAAAVFAVFAAAAYAGPFGPGGPGGYGAPGCPAGATPGTANCPAYGSGQGAGYAQRGIGWQRWDANGDGVLTREEVASAPRLSQQFEALDANHDGLLTSDELPAPGQGRGFGGRGFGGQGGGLARWDANGDGKLSKDEVANAPRLSQEFDAIDADHDGFLTLAELQASRGQFAGRGFGRQGGGLARWDANGDGKLSKDEVANAPRLSQEFDAIDADHDGFVTLAELQAARASFAGHGGRRGS